MRDGMIDRIIRAIRLDPTLYREVADDESYMTEGIIIVAIVTLLSAFGAGLGAAIGDTRARFLRGIPVGRCKPCSPRLAHVGRDFLLCGIYARRQEFHC